MASQDSQGAGIDLAGAARDLDAYTKRYAPIWQQPDVPEVYRLLTRNPAIAPALRQVAEQMIRELPNGIGLEQPLFGSSPDK